MPLFDHLRCLYPTNGQIDAQRVFQTVDTPAQCLAEYEIRPDGRLWTFALDIEGHLGHDQIPIATDANRVTPARGAWECVEFTGEIRFSDQVESTREEFCAVFVRGRLRMLMRTSPSLHSFPVADVPPPTAAVGTSIFTVIDTRTGKEADIHAIAAHDEWARTLIHTDLLGWLIGPDGELALADGCGGYARPSEPDRFRVHWHHDAEPRQPAHPDDIAIDHLAARVKAHMATARRSGASPLGSRDEAPARTLAREVVTGMSRGDLLAVAAGLARLATQAQAEQTLAAVAAEQHGAAPLPKAPSLGLLMSMAIRYDHGLGMPGYYDALNGTGDHARRIKVTLAMMRQLYEEVAGYGFYRPQREQAYAQRAAAGRS